MTRITSNPPARVLNLPGVYSPGGMKQDHSDVARDGLILTLWGQPGASGRMDTRSIASALNMREADVANRLAWLRDRAAI